MSTSTIVMFDPASQRLSNVVFVDGNHEIQTLATSASDQSFAIGICLGQSVWSFQDRQSQRLKGRIQFPRIDTVAIMNDESVSFIARNTLSKLLQRPIGCRVARDIEMKESSRTDFHDEKDIDQLECRRRHNEEIAGNDDFGMVAQEHHPALLRVCRTLRRLWHVAPNCAWRNPDADLQQQFIGNTLFSPG